MPPGPARPERDRPARPRSGPRRARAPRFAVEALEPRRLLSGPGEPVGGPAPGRLGLMTALAAEVEAIRAVEGLPPQAWPADARPPGKLIAGLPAIGEAEAPATGEARSPAPPPTLPGSLAKAARTWVINNAGFEPGAPAPSDAAEWGGAEPSWLHSSLDKAALMSVGPGGPGVVRGTVRPGEGTDFFRFEGTANGYRVAINAADPDNPMADWIVLYDDSGRKLGDWAIPRLPGTMVLELQGTAEGAGQGFYLGVGPAGWDPSYEGEGESYEVRVEPMPSATGTGGVPTAPKPGPNEHPATPPARPSPGGTPAAMASPDRTVGAAGGPLGGELPSVAFEVVTAAAEAGQGGPEGLPVLEAAPFGGVLEAAEAPAVGRADDGVRFDLALAGLFAAPLEGPAAEPGAAEPPGWPLVAPAPGEPGLPLLAAAYPRSEGVEAAPGCEETVVPVERGDGPTPGDRPLRSELVGVRRAVLPAAFGLIATLAVTYHLADPAPPGPRRRGRARLWRRWRIRLRRRRGG